MAKLPISPRFVENAIFCVVALFLSDALVRAFSGGDTHLVTAGDRRFEFLLAVLYFAVILIGLAHLRQTIRVTLHVPALLGLLLLACVSSIWAAMPGLVLRRTVGVAGATIFGLVLASRLDLDELLALLRRVYRITMALTLAAWAVGPIVGADLVGGESTTIKGYQIEIEAGAWRGIFNHKNALGAAMAVAILVEWHMPGRTVRAKVVRALCLCSYAVLLLLSHSVTALLSAALTVLFMLTIKTLRHQYRVILPVLLLVTLVSGSLIALNATSVTGALGRSADLTGRADLWHWAVMMIRKRPYLGYGFSSFWQGASDESTVIENHIGWSPEYAHNGYLEILLSLGIAGLLVFIWFAGTGLHRAAIRAKAAESMQDLWPLAFLVFFLLHNLGECTILWQNSLEWAVAVATVASAHPSVQPHFRAASDEEDVVMETASEYS